jgi:hypothetical protein
MQLRSRLFGILALLSLAWLCYGFSATGSAFNSVVSTPVAGSSSLTASEANAARTAGAAIGGGLGLTFFACTSLPFTLLFGLLAWRNAAGYRNQKRHEELMDIERQKLASMQRQ